MELNIDLKEYATKANIDAGAQLAGTVSELRCTADGQGLLLKGRYVDSFNFVDHPRVLVDSTGTKVLNYRCDCPKWRMEQVFCPHCVALVSEQPELPAVTQTAATEAPQEPPMPRDDGEHPVESGPELLQLSYKFCNGSFDLYPLERDPRIPLERYIQVFGNNARARSIFKDAGSWGGSCFGFVSTTSMMYRADSDGQLTDFNPEAQQPSQLKLTDRSERLGLTLLQYLEALQIMQYGGGIWYSYPLEKLASAVEDFQKGQGKPVCMAIYDKGYTGGHAILPYRLERRDSLADILHIYDPNHPMQVRYGYLIKDEAGNYIHWRYDMNCSETYTSKNGGALFLGFYDLYKQAWENRGGGSDKNLLSLEPGTALLDGNGAVLVRMNKSGVEIFGQDISLLPATGSQEPPLLSLPTGAYRVAVEDPELPELKTQLIGIDLSAELSTTAREAEISVDDSTKTVLVRIPEQSARYFLEICNTLSGQEELTALAGTVGQQELHLVQQSGQLYASGLTDETRLRINGEEVSPDKIGQLEEEEAVRILNSEAEKPGTTDEPKA